MVAVGVLVLWTLTGPLLGFSDTWQLVINTSTTIVTFLMVCVVQNTQNRDTAALQVKLDALMLELKISNAKLYEAENEGEKEIERPRRRIEDAAEDGSDQLLARARVDRPYFQGLLQGRRCAPHSLFQSARRDPSRQPRSPIDTLRGEF